MSSSLSIGMIGVGYVGTTTAACLADLGYSVSCVDVNPEKIIKLHYGEIPFYEPGLEGLVRTNIKANRLTFSSDGVGPAVKGKDVVFLAVGTPSDKSGQADLSFLFDAAAKVIEEADGPFVLVTKSTVPPGTALKLQEVANKSRFKISVASNPEFLKEGDAVNDFMKPERVIIGVEDDFARETLEQLYRPLMLRDQRVMVMDTKSAEMTKYAANAMLATRIGFMNEMADICEIVGANVDLVRKGIGSDSRIGNKFLYPGVGFFGSCFRKDLDALNLISDEGGYEARILTSVLHSNQDRAEDLMYLRLGSYFSGEAQIAVGPNLKDWFKDKTIAIWGLSFKPRTDDIREAGSVYLIEHLMRAGAQVRAYDRAAGKNIRERFPEDKYPGLKLFPDELSALDGADALVLMTEWSEFRQADWEQVGRRMKGKAVFDGRNIWDPEAVEKAGFRYEGIGRPRPSHKKEEGFYLYGGAKGY